MSAEWYCKKRYLNESKHFLKSCLASDHPLKLATVTVFDSKGTRGKLGSVSTISSTGSSTLSLDPLSLAFDGSDPLSQFYKQEAMDPLSLMAAEIKSEDSNAVNKTKPKTITKISPFDSLQIESWSSRRSAVLNKYTTSEKLSIVTSFLTGGEMIKTQTTMSEKVKHRLEQLDDFEDGSVRKMMNLTQQEYIIKIEQLNQELVQAWNTDQRVKALKIAIQCSKLLADTSVVQFYPSKFVLITDILDIFGKLVFERLRSKAESIPNVGRSGMNSLPEKFTPDMVPETAKETCMNWFCKIASIRELLPRLYVEMAILKCYSFLTTNEFTQALLRLTKTIRGIGDPLVAIYARCYLCRVGMTVTSDREYIKENLNDVLTTYHTIFNGRLRSDISKQRLDLSTYLSLYMPALDWIIQGLSVNANETVLDEILKNCQIKKHNALLYLSLLNSFRHEFIASRALLFVTILASCAAEGITKGQLFRSLGSCLSQCPPQQEQRMIILTTSWRIINTLTEVGDYISCVEMWAQYTTEHFGIREINSFLGDVLTKMTRNRVFEQHYHELQNIVDKIVNHTKDLEGLLAMDNFLPTLDLFQKESVKLDVCKNILIVFKNTCNTKINDPVVTNGLMYICKVMNDSVNALTVEDERRQISNLISYFVRSVYFGRNFEQQLNFYVEARAAFLNLDTVYITLIHCVNELANNTNRIVKGQHTRKTSYFVKACIAYNFITIPSIVSVITRLDLYLLTGQIALQNLCLGQADACFETALNLIPDLPKVIEIDGKPKQTEPILISYLCNFLSTLIIVPDSPDAGVLYLLQLLLNVVQEYPFESASNSLATVYLCALDMLSTISQETYPYHIRNVVSNDELYGSDPKFIAEINKICTHLVEQILVNLKYLGDNNHFRLQSQLAFDLFQRIVIGSDLGNEKTLILANNLWNLAMKQKHNLDLKIPIRIIQYLEYSLDNQEKRDEQLHILVKKIKTKL